MLSVEPGMPERDPRQFGITYLSADKNYVEYTADPASQLAMACKRLVDATKEKKRKDYQTPLSWAALTKHGLFQFTLMGGTYSILGIFNAIPPIWVVVGFANMIYLMVLWYYTICNIFFVPLTTFRYYYVAYKNRHVPEEYLHLVKVFRRSKTIGDETETDILISLQSTLHANWTW